MAEPPIPGIPGFPSPPGPTPPTTIAELAPFMPEEKRAKLAQASGWPWHVHGDINEGSIFERKYREITNFYLAHASNEQMMRAILWAFRLYRPIAEAICKEFTYSTEKVNGSFVGDVAAGNMQSTMRPLVRDTFTCPATPAVGPVLDWRQSEPLALWPNGSVIHVIPSRRAWAAAAACRYAEAVEKEQTWLILGYAEFLQDFPVAVALHDWINDSQGWRLQNYFYPNHAMSNLLFMQHGSPRWVESDHRYRCDAWVRENKNVCLWPIGIEILIATRVGTATESNAAQGWP